MEQGGCEMTSTFRALILDQTDAKTTATVGEMPRDRLMPGDVTVKVAYSTVNYKDGLAVTGKGRIVRSFPFIPGIDLAGTVETSDNPAFKPGDEVILNGWGVGERHFGGYATLARVRGDWLVKKPAGLTTRQAMAIGTAGYTAMLSVIALEDHGVKPGAGPVLVTGAAGGVGSVAVALLARLGYEVAALTGRAEQGDYLKGLGAASIVARADLEKPGKPLEAERWAGVVDAVGGQILVNAIAATRYGGAVSACGLAASSGLPGTVLPFILRGVNLLGIDSVMCPRPRREVAWQRLARDLPTDKLEAMIQPAGLADVPALAEAITLGKVKGRVVVDVNK
jgi:acrylyl-CoA reductase (NADPH)